MGKGKRNKMKRDTPPPKASLEVLHAAFEFVGDHFGTETKCVEAAAMLHGIAKHLGYDLQVRPVSVGVNDLVSGNSATMGMKVQEGLAEEDLTNAVRRDPEDENYGHVVLTLEDPAYLIDPNLKQLNPGGVNVPNVFAKVETAHPDPENALWRIQNDAFDILYLLDDGARPLLEDFEKWVAMGDAECRQVANALRRGRKVKFA
jgi:hypothetical protein